MATAVKTLSDDIYLSHDDDQYIDFSSAGLYLVGLQTTLATVACSAASVACCWLLPVYAISAVRTLTITCIVAYMTVRYPIRIGRTRGVTTIFNALRPALVLYIMMLVAEQLVHTCVIPSHQPIGISRHVIFHFIVAVMAAAGLWRAAKPLAESDGPFLLSVASVLVIAMLPPPAVPLSGPLCQPPSMFGAGERLLRAFLFAVLYTVHIYCSPPQRNSMRDLAVSVIQASAASTWILACHTYILWLPVVQAAVALWARFGVESAGSTVTSYSTVDTRSDSGMSDAELGSMPPLRRDENGVLMGVTAREDHGFSNSEPIFDNLEAEHDMPCVSSPVPRGHDLAGVPVEPRQLASLVGSGNGAMSAQRMAQIAAQM